jgi:23S rRNA (uracil1939-C5)-methyltransferase
MLFSFMKQLIVDIKKIGINGEGIGYLNKKPVFIQGALTFERVIIHQLKEYPTYYKATLKQVIKQNDNRVKPPCYIQHQCGACSMMHASLDFQEKAKLENLKQALYKYANLRNQSIPLIRNPLPLGYRNQCKFILGIDQGNISSGMFESESNRWLGIDHCIIHEPTLERIRKQVVALLNKHQIRVAIKAHEEGHRYLIIRVLEGKAQVTLVATKKANDTKLYKQISELDGVEGVFLSVNDSKSHEYFGDDIECVAKNKTLDVTIHGLALSISPKSFMQLNTKVATSMMTFVADLINPNENVVEAYSGTGLMSLLVAKKAKSVFGFDINKDAILNANNHATMNSMSNITFKAMDANVGLKEASKRFKSFTLIVDPPRTGLSKPFIEQLLKSNVSKMIYVSCNPSTLAKDIANLKAKYSIISITAFDMFSHTPHVETVVLMSRK